MYLFNLCRVPPRDRPFSMLTHCVRLNTYCSAGVKKGMFILSVNSFVTPGKSGSGFELSLEWCGLVIHTAHATRTTRSRFFFLGHLSHQCFGGEHERGDRSGVLQRCASHLGRIDDAGLYQVLIFAGSHVEPFIAPAILDFLNDQSAFLPSVVGKLARRRLE